MITESEILEQISKSIEERRTEKPDEDPYAFSSRELVEITGISKRQMRKLLRDMLESGEVENTKVYRKTITGVVVPTPAYRFNPAK